MKLTPILAALCAAISPAFAGDPTSDAVAAAVFDYFDGQTERSAEKLNRAFAADTAAMVFTRTNDDGEMELTSMPLSDILPNWAKGEPGTEPRTGKILSMDVVDDRMATVIFDSDGRFLDALTLLKVNGEWKIVAKVFVRQ